MKVWQLVLLLGMVLSVAAGAAPNGRVILMTDYGADSIYVGALKGAIYSTFPEAKMDSITNSVPPFDIVTGAYMLLETADLFPQGTTFCCVVDPGVGSSRKAIAIETKDGRFFVGPDNGLLSLAADKHGIAEVRECTNKTLWRASDISHTFQGRDIFGPVAAALARGVPLAEVGPALNDIVKLDITASRVEDQTVHGEVIRADDYGNLITNIPGKLLTQVGIGLRDTIEVTLGKTNFTAPFVTTYSGVPEGQRLVAIQSAGFVELAINKGSLAKESGQGVRSTVSLKKVSSAP
ncbi:MAG: S-adenosyl-l-methionine hydroxide adenosyltransferase family protein [Candidatus Hydrogenedentes bacterium]|nr:S-adenosyl-l-methionine hydroxide adenosyltransferase family protein [Candidatus Hydrogenedentota bacterium]